MSLLQIVSPAVSSITDLVATAGEVSAELNLPASPEEARSGTWKVITYLPAIASGGLAVAQAVGCIAEAIIGNIGRAIYHGVSAFIAGYAAICVASYIPLMSLEGYAKALAQKVRLFSKVIGDIKTSNQQLGSTVSNLQKEVADRKETLIQKEKIIKETLQKFDSTVKKLEDNEKKIASLQKLLDNFQKTTGTVSTKINEFVSMNKRLSINSEDLSYQLEGMKLLQQSIQLSLDDIDEQHSNLQSEKKEAEKVASTLFSQFNQLIELHVQLKREKEALVLQIHELQKNALNVEKNVVDLKKVNQQIEDKKQGAKAAVDSLSSIASSLEFLNSTLKASPSQPHQPRDSKDSRKNPEQ